MTIPWVNPVIVANLDDMDQPWSGIYLAEDIQLLHQGIASGSWIDISLGGFGVAMDALGLIVDPLGTLVSWGVAWLIEHLKPLSDGLDKLAGDPGAVMGAADRWRKMGTDLSVLSQEYFTAVAAQIITWTGPASNAYRTHAKEYVGTLETLGHAAGVMAMVTEGVGTLVALVRTFVRDAIADFVSVLAVRLWEWLGEEVFSFGLATPWVISQVTALAGRWVEKIAHLLRALISSLRRLVPMVRKLEKTIEELRVLLRRLAHDDRGELNLGAFFGNGRTKPSHAPDPNATPHGTRTEAGPTSLADRGKRLENGSADVLAQNGFNVEQNPAPRPNGKEPDYLVEGEYFDCYSPDTDNLNTITRELKRKVGDGNPEFGGSLQADRIVLNLSDSPLTDDALKAYLQRYPIAGLKEIMIIRGGVLTPFFPF